MTRKGYYLTLSHAIVVRMATTKKSTKAKTKTTKRPSTKKSTSKQTSAKKPAAVKSTKPTKSVKATVQKPAKVKKPRTKLTETQLLRRLNGVSAFVHLAGAVAVGILMGNYFQQIVTGLVVKDELASGQETVFVPAIHHLYDANLRWCLVVLLVAGAILPLIQLRRSAAYDLSVKARRNPLRWADKAIISGVMLTVVAMLSGVQDFMTLKVIGGLIVVTALLGWLSERQNADPKSKPDYSAFGISLLSGMLPWLIILGYAAATPIWGMIRSPWYVYALYAVVFASSAAYAINGYNYVRRFRNWTNYAVVERNYIVIDILARASFAVILIIGLSK